MAKNKAPKKAAQKRVPKPNVSNFLWSFVNYLRTRQTPITLGHGMDDAGIYQILEAYIFANNLPELRKEYNPSIEHPRGVDHITSHPFKTMDAAPPTAQEVVKQISGLLDRFSPNQNNAILGAVLQDVRQHRSHRIRRNKQQINQHIQELKAVEQYNHDLDNIVAGNFTVLSL